MGATVERRNIVGLQKVVRHLAEDLTANGFDLLSVNDSSSGSIDENSTKILMKATKAVDPLAIEDDETGDANYDNRQPWRLHMFVDEAKGGIQVAACTPTNVLIDQSGAYSISVFGAVATGSDVQRSGYMTYDSWDSTISKGTKHVAPGGKMTPDTNAWTFHTAYWGIDNQKVDYESIPFSYRVTITPRGIMFFMWIESRDGVGNGYGYFAIQRMVDENGAAVVDGKAPLYAVFSPNGGGGDGDITVDGETFDALNAPQTIGILKFVVREQDVNAPTVPHSAVTDTADSSRIINSVQQVSTSEDNKFIINFPKGLNTQRYSYPHELDLFAYTSADVISQWSETELTVYGEGSPRKYKAMNANHKNNKGMRILMLVEGGGI